MYLSFTMKYLNVFCIVSKKLSILKNLLSLPMLHISFYLYEKCETRELIIISLGKVWSKFHCLCLIRIFPAGLIKNCHVTSKESIPPLDWRGEEGMVLYFPVNSESWSSRVVKFKCLTQMKNADSGQLQTNVTRMDAKCTAGRKDDIYQSSIHQ